MTPNETTDRADATVWLPLLHILGGVAQRVARRHPEKPRPIDEQVAVDAAAGERAP